MTDQRPIRVLLVDDHRSVLWGLERLIAGEKSQMTLVGEATNFAAAFDLVEQHAPDVIVLDLDLGAESGLDLIPKFLAWSNAKILVLTGMRDRSIHDQAILAGAKGVVEKEERAEVILDAIKAVNAGELWLGRSAVGRVLELSIDKAAGRADLDVQRIAKLTAREREVVAAIVMSAGASAKKIADGLNISEHTLRNHFTSIYEKLDVANRLELFAFAQKIGVNRFRP